MKTSLLVLVALLCAPLLSAQDQPAGDWKSASSNQAGHEYPKINAERRVMFRVEAPDAKSVNVSFHDTPPFTKGKDGAWYGTTAPLDEGFHYYTIKIDGGEMPDPNSRMYFGALRWGSAVEVPAHDEDFYALKNVPHGQLREIYFHSPSTNAEGHAFVYTPPGYDQHPEQRYPVLYLQHGWGENEYGWGQQGHTTEIMDNLIAAGKTQPFLVVMTYGMTNDTRFGHMQDFKIEPFETVLVKELIPYVDTQFRTLADQPHRAMAGLSMGGFETKTITLKHLETFSAIGLFSGGSIRPADITDLNAFKAKNKVVFISFGSREVEGGKTRRGDDPKADTAALQAAGINAHYYVSENTAHEWLSWRRDLQEFAPMLFKE